MGHIFLLYNFLWGGAPNLLLSCQTTGFHSASPLWTVWYMGRSVWCSWIKCLHGVYIWISQSELLLWIQMWIHNLTIIGKIQSTWIWSYNTCRFLVAQQFPFFRAWVVLMWKYLELPCKVHGSCPLVLPWFLLLDLDLRLKFEIFENITESYCWLLVLWLDCMVTMH